MACVASKNISFKWLSHFVTFNSPRTPLEELTKNCCNRDFVGWIREKMIFDKWDSTEDFFVMGFALEAAKSAARCASIWTTIYLVGYFKASPFWVLMPLLMGHIFEDEIKKASSF